MSRTTKTPVIIEQNSEIRKFKMHPDLLFSVIKSQAGTQEKAILEAVMNAVDAGATRCDITIDGKGYTISDDGKGFVSRKEVDEFFETFGTPHKEGDATYGRFRMGRGQLFAFSSTVWKTTSFEMHVDIKKTGLDYVLKENLPVVSGCTIVGKWYDKMGSQELFNMIKELEQLIKYMQIPVYVNEKNFSVDTNKQKWDYQENDFFVKVNKNGNTLSVYNMGALVAHYPASRFGVAGTVVTKSALKVNFARNDVLVSECSLWRKITKKMKEIMGIETAKKTVLTDSEREAILENVVCKDSFLKDVFTKGLLIDITGKRISFKTLIGANKITFSTGDYSLKKVEERIHDSKIALVLNENTLKDFYVKTPVQFVNKVQELIEFNNEECTRLAEPFRLKNWTKYFEFNGAKINEHGSFNPMVLNIDELISSIKQTSDTIDEKKLTKKETIFLKALKETNETVARLVYFTIEPNDEKRWENSKQFTRTLSLGKSEVANAWTDGKTFITIESKHVTSDPMKIVHLLVHEYCHNVLTMESHDHGNEFYQLYHDVYNKYSHNIFGATMSFQKTFNKIMLKENIKPKKEFDENIATNEQFEELHKDTSPVEIFD